MKYDEISCKFNMDTDCVELLLRDGRKRSSSVASLPKHRRHGILYSDEAVLSIDFCNFFGFF